MKILVNHKKIRVISMTSKDGSVTWFFPLLLFVCLYNPFNNKHFTKRWFGIIPAGGFHIFGIRVAWSLGAELLNKRIVKR